MQNLEINSISKIEFQEIFRGLTTQYGKFLGYKDEPKKDGKRGKKIASVPAKPPYADHLAGVAKIGINASKNFKIEREDRKREQFDPDSSISHCDAG